MKSTCIKSTGTGSSSQFIQCYRSISSSGHHKASEKYGLIELWGGCWYHVGRPLPNIYYILSLSLKIAKKMNFLFTITVLYFNFQRKRVKLLGLISNQYRIYIGPSNVFITNTNWCLTDANGCITYIQRILNGCVTDTERISCYILCVRKNRSFVGPINFALAGTHTDA